MNPPPTFLKYGLQPFVYQPSAVGATVVSSLARVPTSAASSRVVATRLVMRTTSHRASAPPQPLGRGHSTQRRGEARQTKERAKRSDHSPLLRRLLSALAMASLSGLPPRLQGEPNQTNTNNRRNRRRERTGQLQRAGKDEGRLCAGSGLASTQKCSGSAKWLTGDVQGCRDPRVHWPAQSPR